jgi:hypothetical protein
MFGQIKESVYSKNWTKTLKSGNNEGLAVFVNKINNLPTQSWRKILAFAS